MYRHVMGLKKKAAKGLTAIRNAPIIRDILCGG
jgi:hypothetical protein